MAEINLLKQKSVQSPMLQDIPKLLNKLLVVVFVGVIIFYGWQFVSIGSITNQINATQKDIADKNKNALTSKDRSEVLARQAQLKQYASLAASHLYWSNLFPVLAKSTLQGVSYTDIKVDSTGGLVMQAVIPDLQNLDKYLQVFDLPQFNKYFSNVRITSYDTVESKTGKNLVVEIRMDFNRAIITNYDLPN